MAAQADPGTIKIGTYTTCAGHIAHVWEWGQQWGEYCYRGTIEGQGVACWDAAGRDLTGDDHLFTNTALIPAHDPTAPAVTLVTAFAQTSDLSEDEYRRIFDRLAEGRSLRNIELALHSAVSFAWWGKYAAGEKTLDRDRKNELLTWERGRALPPTPAEAVAAGAHPDAAVYHVGYQIANRVVMVSADVESVNLRVNGNCTVEAGSGSAYTHRVTGVTGHSRRATRKTVHLSIARWNRLNSARLRAGKTWDEFVAQLEDPQDLTDE